MTPYSWTKRKKASFGAEFISSVSPYFDTLFDPKCRRCHPNFFFKISVKRCLVVEATRNAVVNVKVLGGNRAREANGKMQNDCKGFTFHALKNFGEISTNHAPHRHFAVSFYKGLPFL